MTSCVIDASVLAKWFKPANEAHLAEADALYSGYYSGAISVSAPHLLFLEVLNSAARRWQWPSEQLIRLTTDLESLRFQVTEPRLTTVLKWATAGLTAYDACYVALAEELRTFVITDDSLVLRSAGTLARSLPQAAAELTA